VPLRGRGAGSPSNTMWPGPRPTRVPSFILIHSIQPFGQNTPTSQTGNGLIGGTILGRPFVLRFALCCRTVVCLSGCPVTAPKFLAHICWFWPNGWMDQDATWQEGRPRPKRHCKMGTQLPPPQKEQSPPIFSPCLLWPNGCMDQDATWYEGRLPPRPHCVTWRLSSLQGEP